MAFSGLLVKRQRRYRQKVFHIVTLQSLTLIDPPAIEALLDAAFGCDRYLRTAYTLRAGMHWLPALSCAVVDENNALIGSLQSWPVAVIGEDCCTYPLILVGPVAVAPAQQRRGIGRLMMNWLIEQVDKIGVTADPLIIIGDPEYYARYYGFSAEPTGGWQVPGPVERHRLLARIRNGVALPSSGMLGPLHTSI